MQCFVCGEKYFEMDSFLDRQPVKVVEDWGDVFSGAGTGEEAGSRVLNILELAKSRYYYVPLFRSGFGLGLG